MTTSYVRKARTIRLPVITDTQVNAFDTGQILSRGSYILNGTVLKYPNGTHYVTQRPAFAVFNQPSDGPVSDERGRAVFYWGGHGIDELYFVNNTTIYKEDYSTALSPGFSNPGTSKIETAELNGVLVFLDAQGQEMFYIDSNVAAGTTPVAMQPGGTDFTALPHNNSKTLAHGIVVLDRTMYVLATDGTVWGCTDVGIATVWTDALNFITAEKEDDFGVYIDKHYDNIVVFGRRTIEFLYDAGNTTGSPLGIRQDVSYNIGCADPQSVWRNGDDIYFLGIDTSGQIQPYVLREFKIEPIGNTSGISFLTTSKSLDDIQTMGTGLSSGGVTYYALTLYSLDANGDIDPTATFVYNSTTNIWTEWEFSGDTIDNFPLVDYTITDDSRIGEGIMSNGSLVWADDQYNPADTTKLASENYVVTDYVTPDTYVQTSSFAKAAGMKIMIRLDDFDNDSRDWKFAHQLRFVGDETTDCCDLTVRWHDGGAQVPSDTFTGQRSIDISNNRNKLTRLGRFKSRSFEFEYDGDEQIRFEGIDLDITEGTH